MRPSTLASALLDLVAPAACVGCGAGGALACPACLVPLQQVPRLSWPAPSPSGLPPPYAVAAYDGPVRDLVVAFKERAASSLATPLGAALARCVIAATTGRRGRPVALVPVASSPVARRARGHDHAALLTRRAAADLRSRGVDAAVVPALRHARRVADSAGLTAADRARNMAGALVVPARWRPLLTGCDVLVVDDILTTGATLAEAARALRVTGAEPVAAAVVAATRRRAERRPVDLHKRGRQV